MIDAFFQFARENPEYFDIVFFVLQREGAKREGRLDAAQIQRLKDLERRSQTVAGQVLRRAGAGNARRDRATLDALWSMLAGVIFYFSDDPSFDGVAAQAKQLLLSAMFPVD